MFHPYDPGSTPSDEITDRGVPFDRLNPAQATRLQPVVRRVSPGGLQPVDFGQHSLDNAVDSWWTTDIEYQRDEHRVHLVVYYLIWCPKRRKP
ncbi:MAG: hypothetical protein WBC80_13510, partial [Isosphaeraceae bacterium]